MCKDGNENSNNIRPCHCIIDLTEFGINSQGCIADKEWRESIHIPCFEAQEPGYYIYTPSCILRSLGKLDDGKHGIIEGGERYSSCEESEPQLVFIKKPKVSGKSLLYEALIQKVVGDSLRRGGFPTGAARVFDIFMLRNNSIGFTMEPISGKTMQELIHTIDPSHMVRFIVDCIFQICAMLLHLEKDIGMNHRDLKPSNIICRFHPQKEKRLHIGRERIIINSQLDISFIDFGFSCIGIDNGSVRVGDVYSSSDPCPKDGRDIYMFLAFLYLEIHSILPEDFLRLFEKWLNMPRAQITEYLQGGERGGGGGEGDGAANFEELIESIYCLAGNKNINRLPCTPQQVIHDLQHIGNA